MEEENIIDSVNNCMGTGKIASVVLLHKILERLNKTVNVRVKEKKSSTWYIPSWVHRVTDWRLMNKY